MRGVIREQRGSDLFGIAAQRAGDPEFVEEDRIQGVVSTSIGMEMISSV